MEEILAKLLATDNSAIQEGTAELKEAFKKPESTTFLGQIVLASPNPAIRQYAAVLLRKRYTKGEHWKKLPANMKAEMKSMLLQGLVNDPEKIVKNAIAQLIGTIVKHELPTNSWPEIFQFIQQLVSSDNMAEKELAMFTLTQMTDIAPEVYLAHAQSLMSLLNETFCSLQGMNNPVAYYIVMTLQNLACLAESNQVMTSAYNQMIPYALTTIEALATTSEEKAEEALELFYYLLDGSSLTTLAPHVKNLVTSCLNIARNKSIGDDLKMKAVGLIAMLVKEKRRALLKHKLIEPIVDVLFELLSYPPDSEENEIYMTDDDDENSPVTCANLALVEMATQLKPDFLLPLLLRHIEPSIQSANPYAKKAAFLAAAAVSEGCPDYIRTKYLESFLQCICQGIRDSSPVVRNSALFALAKFSQNLQPKISQYANELLPVLFEYLTQVCVHYRQEKTEHVSVDRIFYALGSFCEYLKDEIVPYLPTLMGKIFEILNTNASNHVKELALNTIDAAAMASEAHILPYLNQILAIIDNGFMGKVKDPTSYELQLLETLGVLAESVGKDHFAPLVSKYMNLAFELIEENDDPGVRVYVYRFFASIASLVKQELAPVLPKIIDLLFGSIRSSEGVVIHLKDNEDTALPIYEDLHDGSDTEEDIEYSDNEDDDDDDDVAGYSVTNVYIEEKNVAIVTLNHIALHTEEAFLPYLEKSFEEVFKMSSYPQEDIKKSSIYALTQFCVNFSEINTTEGQAALLKALSAYVPRLSEIIRLDNETLVVTCGLEALGELLEKIKESVVVGEGHKEAIMNCVTEVLTGKIECQDQDEQEDDDESEKDELLIECAGDVLANFGKVISPEEFAFYFRTALPLLKEGMKENKSESQRSFAVGTISECLSGLKHMTAQFVPQLFTLLKKRTEDTCPEVRNNAYYGIGELVFWGRDAVYPHYNEILQLLAAALNKEEHAGPRDNIVGVIARLIITNYSLIDIERVFPTFVQQLPLKQDFEEYKSVFNSILTLYRAGHEVIKPHIHTLLRIAIDVLHEKKVPNEETKILITEFINAVQQNFPNDWNNVFSKLPPEIQQVLSC